MQSSKMEAGHLRLPSAWSMVQTCHLHRLRSYTLRFMSFLSGCWKWPTTSFYHGGATYRQTHLASNFWVVRTARMVFEWRITGIHAEQGTFFVVIASWLSPGRSKRLCMKRVNCNNWVLQLPSRLWFFQSIPLSINWQIKTYHGVAE